jgi:hypothetical protein
MKMDNVEFDTQTHTYTDFAGREYPSVTKILNDLGLTDYSMIKDVVLAAAANFGTEVHRVCSLYDMGELDWSEYRPEDRPHLEPYLDGWKKFLGDLQPKFLAIELPLISKAWAFAGTPDRVYTVTGNVIADIKTGAPVPATDLQTAGYQILVEENLGMKIRGRITVKLEPGTYKLIQHKDPQDIITFKGAVNLWHWKQKRGLNKTGGSNE